LFLPNTAYDDKISHVRFCVKERGVADGEVLRDLQEGHHVGQHSQPFKQKITEDLGSQRTARQRSDRRRSEKDLCLYPVLKIRQGFPRLKHHFDRNRPSTSKGRLFYFSHFASPAVKYRERPLAVRGILRVGRFIRQPDSLCICRQANSLFSIPRKKRGALKQKILIVYTSA